MDLFNVDLLFNIVHEDLCQILSIIWLYAHCFLFLLFCFSKLYGFIFCWIPQNCVVDAVIWTTMLHSGNERLFQFELLVSFLVYHVNIDIQLNVTFFSWWSLAFTCFFNFIAACVQLSNVSASHIMSVMWRMLILLQCQKTAWLGIFYMCIPTGIAVGYVYGGLVSLLQLLWVKLFLGEVSFVEHVKSY